MWFSWQRVDLSYFLKSLSTLWLRFPDIFLCLISHLCVYILAKINWFSLDSDDWVLAADLWNDGLVYWTFTWYSFSHHFLCPHDLFPVFSVAVTIVMNDVAKVFCALFHDREDGCAFGRLICSEILTAFTQVLIRFICSDSILFRNLRQILIILV